PLHDQRKAGEQQYLSERFDAGDDEVGNEESKHHSACKRACSAQLLAQRLFSCRNQYSAAKAHNHELGIFRSPQGQSVEGCSIGRRGAQMPRNKEQDSKCNGVKYQPPSPACEPGKEWKREVEGPFES